MAEKYPDTTADGSFPINFRFRGLFANKIHETELGQRGLNATRYIVTLGFFLKQLNFRRIERLLIESDVNELNYHFSSIAEMLKEFADEAGLMVDLLDDNQKNLLEEIEAKKEEARQYKKQFRAINYDENENFYSNLTAIAVQYVIKDKITPKQAITMVEEKTGFKINIAYLNEHLKEIGFNKQKSSKLNLTQKGGKA